MDATNVLPVLKGLDSKLDDYEHRVRELSERVVAIEQKGAGSGVDATQRAAQTIGAQVVAELHRGDHIELLGKTRNLRLEMKAAGDPITTTSARTVGFGGVGAPAGGVLGIHTGLPMRMIPGTSAVEYSRFTGTQGAAAQQTTEGGAKAAVRPDHSLVMQAAMTIAGYAKMSRQAVSDSAELRAAVDVTLMRSVYTALDTALVSGATGFAGGLAALATASTSLVYTSLADAVSEGVAAMQVAGFSPDIVAVHPQTWLSLTVQKGGDGQYLSGEYLQTLPPVLRGLRVVLSAAMAEGKGLVMDTQHVELLMVDRFAVEMSDSDSDNFTKNLVTVRGELRFVPVFRSVGAAMLITPKAA